MSMFALGYWLTRAASLAKTCFLELGHYADEWGWEYLDDPATAFVDRRAKALSYD